MSSYVHTSAICGIVRCQVSGFRLVQSVRHQESDSDANEVHASSFHHDDRERGRRGALRGRRHRRACKARPTQRRRSPRRPATQVRQLDDRRRGEARARQQSRASRSRGSTRRCRISRSPSRAPRGCRPSRPVVQGASADDAQLELPVGQHDGPERHDDTAACRATSASRNRRRGAAATASAGTARARRRRTSSRTSRRSCSRRCRSTSGSRCCGTSASTRCASR